MLSVLPDDVMSKIQCGEQHSELFGHRHSTLQSHGLFALAERFLLYLTAMFQSASSWSLLSYFWTDLTNLNRWASSDQLT